MSFDDLDLEFEDEEEAKKKKSNEAVHVDVDLEFYAHDESAKAKPIIKAAPAATRPLPQTRPLTQTRPVGAVVKKLDDARPVAQASVAPKRPLASVAIPKTVGSSALQESPEYDVEGQEVLELRDQVRQLEVSSEIRVGIAEFKTEYITEIMSDMKLLEHQVGQLLSRINAKHPDMKQEALMIKKLLADFTSKKRK